MTSHVAPSPRWLGVLTLAWLALAVLVAGTGRFAALSFPGPQVVIVALIALLVLVGTRTPSVRSWIDAVPFRVLVGLHISRFIGAAFLIYAAMGQLSPVFAERAGVGDIVSAVGALALVLSGVPKTARHRAFYWVWNVVGLLDFVVVVVTAAWVGVQGGRPGVEPLVHLPLSLLPTFAVPILFASHIFIFRRLAAMARDGRAS